MNIVPKVKRNHNHTLSAEKRCHFVLRKLAASQGTLSLLDLGYLVSPQTVRAMAGRGLIKVNIEITLRGAELMQAEILRAERVKQRARVKAAKAPDHLLDLGEVA